MSQGQVNHKCKVSGIPEGAGTKMLSAAEKTECPKVLEAASCVMEGAKAFNTAQSVVKEKAHALLGLMEGAPDDEGGPLYNFKYALNARANADPLFGDTSGGNISQTQLDAITTQIGTFSEPAKAEDFAKRGQTIPGPTRAGLKAGGSAYLDKQIAAFKKTDYYKDNQQKFDDLLTEISATQKGSETILDGPALGKTGCANKLDDALDALHSAAVTDAGIEGSQHAYQGKTAKEAANNAMALINATSAGNIKIEVVYDIQYKEQCILLSQISPLTKYSRALDNVKLAKDDASGDNVTIRRRLPYQPAKNGRNSPLVVEGESFGFINKLTQPRDMSPFYQMTNAEISALQPMIRLYRVEHANDTSKAIAETEIFFDSNLKDSKTILMDKSKRGFGVGIQSFDLVFDGQDMFAQKRCIKANLTLFATDFGELLKSRGGFRYIDLALKTGKNIKSQKTKNRKSNDDLNFRLKAVFGWQMSNAAGPARALQDALKKTFVSVNLTPVTHTFDFDEFGRVKFNIEYLAYIEEALAKNNFNIFTDPETYSTILRRRLAFESADRSLNCKESEKLKETVKNIKSTDQERIKNEKKNMHSYLMRELFAQDYIHFLNFSREDLESAIKLGPMHDLVTNKVRRGNQELNATLDKDVKEALVSSLNKSDADSDTKRELASAFMVAGQDSISVAFFYLGDLLSVIMGSMDSFLADTKKLVKSTPNYNGLPIDKDILDDEITSLQRSAEEYKKFRLMMGPLEIIDHKNNTASYVNFADVPISVKYFSEWLTSKLLKKDQALYPLTQFLKDLFNDFLRNYLNDDSCYPFSIKQKVRLFEGVVTSYPKGGASMDEVTQAIGTKSSHNRLLLLFDDHRMPLLNIKGKTNYDKPNPGIGSEINYFIFYAGRTQPMELLEGEREADEQRGIFHYLMGKNRGLLKNITLNKTDSPGLKEVRFEQEGYDGLHQLRELYDVEIDSYANMTAFPGNYIFVDPRGFAPQLPAFSRESFDLTDLGVGGYFMVTKASHSLGPGIANTKLNAVWVASAGDGEGSIVESGRGANEMKAAKCISKQSKGAKTSNHDVSDFEYSGGSDDFSSLDENPDGPTTAAAIDNLNANDTSTVDPTPPTDEGETASIGWGGGSKL